MLLIGGGNGDDRVSFDFEGVKHTDVKHEELELSMIGISSVAALVALLLLRQLTFVVSLVNWDPKVVEFEFIVLERGERLLDLFSPSLALIGSLLLVAFLSGGNNLSCRCFGPEMFELALIKRRFPFAVE